MSQCARQTRPTEKKQGTAQAAIALRAEAEHAPTAGDTSRLYGSLGRFDVSDGLWRCPRPLQARIGQT